MKTKLFFVAALATIMLNSMQKANAQNWSLNGNSNVTDTSKLGSKNNKPLSIITRNTERIRVDVNGLVGIGTTIPSAKLQVAGNVKIDGANTLEFGAGLTKEINAGKIGYGNITPGELDIVGAGTNTTNRRIKFWSEGGTEFTGNVTIGTSGFFPNLKLVSNDGTNAWIMYSINGTSGNLDLYKNGSFRGSFNGISGVYTASDKRLKKDIVALPGIMENLMKLQPKKYHYKESENTAKLSYGFIAQEVNEIFPEFVGSYKDRKTGEEMLTLNYDNFGVLAIKAIQEQQKQIDDLKQTVENLLEKINTTNNNANARSNTIKLNNASLQQNIPNPFNNSSSVSYYIPSVFHTASLIITDMSGKTLKTYPIAQSGSGKQTFSGSQLTGGMYQYSLIVDGKMIDTKQMVLAK